jgi:hypothetical protein
MSIKPDAAHDGTPVPAAGVFSVVNSRGGDGLGLSFKVEATGRVFRVEPARDPHQPRFWCLRVYRCSAAGVASQTERSWWGHGGMTRADLPAAVSAIRDDPERWLADQELAELRAWIMEPADASGEPDAAAQRRSRAIASSASRDGKHD